MRRWLVAVLVAAVIAAGIDWSVIGVALVILIHAARRPQPVRRTTAILLALLTGILLWANLRPSGWQAEFGGDSPPELDAIHQYDVLARVAALSMPGLSRPRHEISPQWDRGMRFGLRWLCFRGRHICHEGSV